MCRWHMTDENKYRPERFLKMMQLFLKVTKVDSVKGSTFVVMDKNSAQAKLYVRYLGFILPDGMLDFFELVWMETMSLTAREAKKEVAYTGILHIHLIDGELYR